MSNRAQRLMQSLGTGPPKRKTQEDDGTISQLGGIPDRPIAAVSKNKQALGLKRKSRECRSCHYPSIPEEGKICPECGVKQMEKNEWDKNVKKTRKRVTEEYCGWANNATQLFLSILEFGQSLGPHNISEDALAQKRLKNFIYNALIYFDEWQGVRSEQE